MAAPFEAEHPFLTHGNSMGIASIFIFIILALITLFFLLTAVLRFKNNLTWKAALKEALVIFIPPF